MKRRARCYLVRLDDACPTWKRPVWSMLEEALDRFGVKPLVAVVPDCKDKDLCCGVRDDGFWERIRSYQDKGYAIGLHGYQHVFHTDKAGLVPYNRRSEFAGLPLDVQKDKVRRGFAILREQGIAPSLWVAPAHSFDRNTLRAVEQETDIRMISDGIALFPFSDDGFFWIPQQLWRFKEVSYGIWTICLHPNNMTQIDCQRFIDDIAKFKDRITSVDEIKSSLVWGTRKKSFVDRVFQELFLSNRRFKLRFFPHK